MFHFGSWCRKVRAVQEHLVSVHKCMPDEALDLFIGKLFVSVISRRTGLPPRQQGETLFRYIQSHLHIDIPALKRISLLDSSKTGAIDFSDDELAGVEANPTLLGWTYQIWNEIKRRESTWAISYKDRRQAERLSIAAATQIFTEEYMADFLVAQSIASLAASEKPMSFCDPACGAGNMLARVVHHVTSRAVDDEVATYLHVLSQIYGCDIDGVAVEICHLVLLLAAPGKACAEYESLWGMLTANIVALPTILGALERHSNCALLQRSYDCILTNPPYLGRRKLTQEMKDFLDREYPHGAMDLCAAFMQRCVELLRIGGVLGLVTADKWLRLKGYQVFRAGDPDRGIEGFYDLMSLDFVAELGDRAFRSQLDLHDGVRVVLTVGRKCPPTAGHRLRYHNCTSVREIAAKSDYVRRSVSEGKNADTIGVGLAQAELCADRDGTVFLRAAGAPSCIQSSPLRFATVAHVIVGLQTHDDERFVKYHWQVIPDRKRWRIHNKGGGYARWFGLNRWVIDTVEEEQRFSLGRAGGKPLQDWFLKEGWTYSWFANGCVGLRYKGSGWSFGRAASSGFFCEDTRLIAYANSRLASWSARMMGGKIQLPEGVVRALPVPADLSGVHPNLVEGAVALKKNLISADPTDVTFRGELRPDIVERLSLEALLLLVEGALELQVMASVGLTQQEHERLSRLIAPPVAIAYNLVSPQAAEELWKSLPAKWLPLKPIIDECYDRLGIQQLCTLNEESAVSSEQLLASLVEGVRVKGGRSVVPMFPATGPLEKLSRLRNIHPVTALAVIRRGLAESKDASLWSKLAAEDVKLDILLVMLRELGFRWWSEEVEAGGMGSQPLCYIREKVCERMDAGRVQQVLGYSVHSWLTERFVSWHTELFLGVPIVSISEDLSHISLLPRYGDSALKTDRCVPIRSSVVV